MLYTSFCKRIKECRFEQLDKRNNMLPRNITDLKKICIRLAFDKLKKV